MKWMLNTYQVAQNWDVDHLIEMCVKTGYPYVEFLMDFEQAHGLEWDTPKEKFAEVKRKLDDAGLHYGSLTSCQAFHHAEAQDRAESVRKVKQVIDRAKECGCEQVRVLGDRLPEVEDARVEVVGKVAACLRELGEYAAPEVIVGMEMHADFTDPYYPMEVIERVPNRNVGLIFNGIWPIPSVWGPSKAWKWRLPDGATSIKPFYDALRPRLVSMHTHWMERPSERGVYHEWFRLLKADGYTGCVSNECAYTGPDPEHVLRMYTALFETMTA